MGGRARKARGGRPVESLATHARWAVDRFVSKGSGAVIVAACLLVLITSAGAGLLTTWVSSGSIANSSWSDFAILLGGPGVTQSGAWVLRLISLVMVLVGIVFVSLVIGLVVTALQDSIDRVRNGSPPLRDVPDLAILGWSDQLFTLLREFSVAADGRYAAVLSAHPRAWMEAQIRRECGDLGGRLRVDCRTADRSDPRDLELIRIADVSRIVVFGEPQDRDDAAVVKSVFATVTASGRSHDHLLIAEVCGQAVTRSLADVFDRRLVTVDSNELLALVMAQAMRDQGMGQVIDQLTSYRGCEFYDHPVSAAFVGRTFGELVWGTLSASPVGIQREGRVIVLPRPDMEVLSGDAVVVVDQQRRDLVFEATSALTVQSPMGFPSEPEWSSQRILVIGWNTIVRRAVEHLRGFLGPDSSVTVWADTSSLSEGEAASLAACEAVDDSDLFESAPELLSRASAELAAIGPDAVAIVPYRALLQPSQADATTLVVLTTVRAALETRQTRVVSELRETRAASLTALVGPDDLVLSDAVTASTIAQLADRPWLDGVLADLLDWRGSAFFIRAVPDELRSGEPWTYLMIRRWFLARGDLVIGLRVGTVVNLNPDAHEPVESDGLTGVIVVGAAVGWKTGNVESRMADVL